MRPYSFDLRQRAVELYKELGCYNTVAKLLSVHHSWVKNMVVKFELTGSLENNCSNCGRKPSIDEHGRALLDSWLKSDNDLILDELLERLLHEGYECCRATVANTLSAMNITRKKKRPSPKSSCGRMFKRNAKLGSMIQSLDSP